MDDRPTLAIEQWIDTNKAKPRKGRRRVKRVQLEELDRLDLRICANRLNYSNQLHRYVTMVELAGWLKTGKPFTVTNREYEDVTLYVMLKVLAEAVCRGEITVTEFQVRQLIGGGYALPVKARNGVHILHVDYCPECHADLRRIRQSESAQVKL